MSAMDASTKSEIDDLLAEIEVRRCLIYGLLRDAFSKSKDFGKYELVMLRDVCEEAWGSEGGYDKFIAIRRDVLGNRSGD